MSNQRIFIATSVYQLFNAIAITNQESAKKNTDIILLKIGENYVNSVNIVALSEYFNNVYIINLNLKKGKIQKLLYCIKLMQEKGISGFDFHKKYSEVFLSGTEIMSKIISEKLLGHDGNFFYYEDGLASYFSVLNPDTKKHKDFLLKIRYGHYNLDRCAGMYVYEPSCVVNNKKNIECRKINKINRGSKIKFETIFKGKPFHFSRKFVFLNAWFEDERCYELQKQLLDSMIQIVGKENVIVKTHPNESKSLVKEDGIQYIDSYSSFEVSNYYEKWDDCVFISIVSTAGISPKLVYGDRPKVIYLYKFFQQEFNMWPGIDNTINLISKIYDGELMIPNSLEEYKTALQTCVESSK